MTTSADAPSRTGAFIAVPDELRSEFGGASPELRMVTHNTHPAVIAWRMIPFLAVHLAAALVFFVPFAWWGVVGLLASYVFLQIGAAAIMHRYFSHRSFKTSRAFQFVLAVWGCCANQRGPLWWAAHHRKHHAWADETQDPHSPHHEGFWHAHVLWLWENESLDVDEQWVKDLIRYPELRWLNRFCLVPPVLYWIALFGLGSAIGAATGFGAVNGGLLLMVWAGFVANVAAWHATFAINSITHLWGRRRFETTDESRNNLWVALINLGEGWHNNHHFYPHSANSGICWWEIDATYYFIVLLEKLGLVWDVRRATPELIERYGIAARKPRG